MQSAVEHLQHLIRIPSVSSVSNRPMIAYLSDFLGKLGWTTRAYPYTDDAGEEKVNLLAAPSGQSIDLKEVVLAVVCHTDTVPFAAGWHGALQPKTAEGFVYGCGACDVKGFLAAMLTAASQLKAGELTAETRFLFTADEEVGCVGAKRFLAEDILRPRWVVVGEPTSLQPARGGKGYCLAEVTVHGKEAHSALPAHGRSAIYDAARLILCIEEYAAACEKHGDAFFDPPFTTFNVGVIKGGTAKNVIAGRCSFLLEWRPVPGLTAEDVLRSIEERVKQEGDAGAGVHSSVKLLREQAGFLTAADAGLVKKLGDLAGRHPTSIPFSSEASLFAAVADEVVVFGPGDMQTAHSERERVPVEELKEAVGCLRSLMKSF